jgi:hypothetical protein
MLEILLTLTKLRFFKPDFAGDTDSGLGMHQMEH